MHRETDKQKLGKRRYMKDVKATYYNRLSRNKSTEAAMEAFKRPAHYTNTISKKSEEK